MKESVTEQNSKRKFWAQHFPEPLTPLFNHYFDNKLKISELTTYTYFPSLYSRVTRMVSHCHWCTRHTCRVCTLSTLYILSHSVLSTPLWDRYSCPHCKDREIWAIKMLAYPRALDSCYSTASLFLLLFLLLTLTTKLLVSIEFSLFLWNITKIVISWLYVCVIQIQLFFIMCYLLAKN
jgi:hypothetical protein